MMNERALNVFKMASSGFCCTQIMLKLALADEGSENPDLIRAVNGLCAGVGGSQKTCGVLIGGIGIISLYAGKGREMEYQGKGFGSMVEEFMAWFEQQHGSMDCIDLIGVYSLPVEGSGVSYPIKCGDILLESYERVVNILVENDYEYGSREEQ